MDGVMQIMIYVVPIITILIFIFTFIIIFSPKARGRFMSKQIKSMKYMMDQSKEDIQNISSNMANATSDGIEATARAIKKGFTSEEEIYCKYCGGMIDKYSNYCKHCGKHQ